MISSLRMILRSVLGGSRHKCLCHCWGMMLGLTQVQPTVIISVPSLKSYLFLAFFFAFCLMTLHRNKISEIVNLTPMRMRLFFC